MSQPTTEARILLALQAYQADPKLSLRRAAFMYDVHFQTLHYRSQGRQARVDYIPSSRKLSDQEEQVIVEYILNLDSRGFPSRHRDLEEMANRLLADRNAPPVGKRWAINFIKRQPELKTSSFRKYDYQRAKCEDPTIICNWFRLVENTIAKYGIRSDDIWNFDETGFMMGVISSGIAVTSSERRENPKSVQPGNREWVTAIQAINAEGRAIDPYLVVAGQYHLANWYQDSNLPGTWAITTTPNGWTDNETGLDWLKHFNRCTTDRSVGAYRLLILYGHESHQSVDFQIYCEVNNIITLCMPPHSSHLLQPLDVGCFGPLKKAYGREIERLIRRSITHVSKTEFFPAFYAAFQATITESNIKGGFRGAGLAPFNTEVVISKLDVQLRTPTPAEEVAQKAQAWTSRTPNTVLEAGSQSKYLERRIGRHHSSSPESILEALRSLTKAVTRNIQKTALVEAENRELREANDMLSRRRRAKRTRLQNKGRMLIQEGQGLIDQIDVNAQVVAESSRSGRGRRSVGPGVRRCGVCGKTGHNARTCQEGIEASGNKYSN
jgi:hypothetical protein